MTIQIHGVPESSYVRTARMACVEVGVAHELIVPGGESVESVIAALRSPAHLALHPFGRMPALVDGDITVFETSAICRYVSARYSNDRLIPSDMGEAVRMEEWVSAANCYIIPDAVGTLITQYIFRDEPDMAVIEEAMPKLRAQYEILDRALSDRTTFAGQDVTVADILLAPILAAVGQLPGGMDLFAGLTNLGRWWEAVSQRDSFVTTEPPRADQEASAA
ncbi:MAG: glutathione S-transferase family protein [Pseudomonadota bacterium]